MTIKNRIKQIFSARIKLSQKTFFVQQLGIMLKAGISLSVALKTLAEQTSSKKFREILIDLQKMVEKGDLLSKGLSRHQRAFGDFFINMVAAGEASGKLEEVLKQLFIQMKKDSEILAKVRGAMIYPAIVITMMFGIGILMAIYVIPSMSSVFKQLNVKLPLPTRILIIISDFLLVYGLYVGIGAIILIFFFIQTIRRPAGKKAFHILLLKTPIIGTIIKKINLARFCRTLSSLLKTDIPIVQSFEIIAKVLGNVCYKNAMLDAKEQIKKGVTIEKSLRPYVSLFPPVVLQMISVGEQTGAVDEILEESAIFYEEDVRQTMTDLPSILEPLLMVVLGIAVGGMAIAIIMPMYSLSQAI